MHCVLTTLLLDLGRVHFKLFELSATFP